MRTEQIALTSVDIRLPEVTEYIRTLCRKTMTIDQLIIMQLPQRKSRKIYDVVGIANRAVLLRCNRNISALVNTGEISLAQVPIARSASCATFY